ncbi:MAG: argininosuccinate synthase, partial [Bacillota bacterium]
YLTLGFESGVPVTLNGQTLKPLELVHKLNKIGANYGVGRIDMVENRLVGIKSREIYEAPAASILMQAHQDLSALVLQRETMHFKETLMPKYSETVYYGLWFSELRQAMQAFFNSFKDKINGEVKLKLYKGQAKVVGRKSNNSLYDNGLATYEKNDSFDHDAAAGFIKLWSLPLKTAGQAKTASSKNDINKRQII